MSRDMQSAVDVTVTKHTESVFGDFSEYTCGNEFLRPYFRSFLKPYKVAHINGCVLLLKDCVRKSALRHAPVKRHLPAFKATFLGTPGAGPHTLVTARGSLAMSASRPA